MIFEAISRKINVFQNKIGKIFITKSITKCFFVLLFREFLLCSEKF